MVINIGHTCYSRCFHRLLCKIKFLSCRSDICLAPLGGRSIINAASVCFESATVIHAAWKQTFWNGRFLEPQTTAAGPGCLIDKALIGQKRRKSLNQSASDARIRTFPCTDDDSAHRNAKSTVGHPGKFQFRQPLRRYGS